MINMKRLTTISNITLTIFLLFAISFNVAADENIVTHRFVTTGNCYLCLLTIEEAGNSVDGVSDCSWDSGKLETSVTYDMSITNIYEIMHAIADSGYDTEWFHSDAAAYQELVGTCCEYIHVIDYTIAQVGYLSLMEIWIYPLDVSEVSLIGEANIFPNPTSGLCQINDEYAKITTTIEVYNILGERILNIDGLKNKYIDLSSLQVGQYIYVVRENNTIVSQSKLIKN